MNHADDEINTKVNDISYDTEEDMDNDMDNDIEMMNKKHSNGKKNNNTFEPMDVCDDDNNDTHNSSYNLNDLVVVDWKGSPEMFRV